MIERMVLLGAFVLGCALPVSAQTTRIGFKLGVASAGFSGDFRGFETGSNAGLMAGALLELPRSRWVSVQPELLYVNKGAAWESNGEETTIDIAYVEIPVLARLNLAPVRGPVAAHVAAGPYLAIEAGCSFERRAPGIDLDADCRTEQLGVPRFETSAVDVGLAFGGGVGYALDFGRVFLDARYGLGLVSVFEGEEDDVEHRVFAVLAGLSVPLGGIR